MHVTIHQEPIDALASDWGALFARDPVASPFASPVWARAWWSHWAGSAQPWLVTVWEAGELVGLAPLVQYRRAGMNVVRGLGEGPADYWQVLSLPEVREPVTKVIAHEIASRSKEWEILRVVGLPETCRLSEALEDAGLRRRPRPQTACPGLDLPRDFEEYLSRLSRRRRSRIRGHLRRLDSGEIQLHEVRCAKEIPGAAERWHQIRLRQWAGRGRQIAEAQRSQRFRHFMRDVMLVLVPANLALLWEFRQGRKLIGSYLNFVDRFRFYQYLGGFDPDVARLEVGKIAIAEGIRSSIQMGRHYYDFLKGSEDYKYRYGAVDHYATSAVFTNRRLRSRGASALC